MEMLKDVFSYTGLAIVLLIQIGGVLDLLGVFDKKWSKQRTSQNAHNRR